MSVNVCERLAAVANRHGMWVKDVVRFVDLLQEACVDAADVTVEIIEAAEQFNRSRIRQIQDKITKWNESINPAQIECQPVVKESQADIVMEPKKVTKSESTRKQVKLFGHSVTAVIRWMGKQGGWTVDDVATAVMTLTERVISDHTIRIQLKAGRDGQRGEPAAITPAQAKQLLKASK